jgi:hypothetical protein
MLQNKIEQFAFHAHAETFWFAHTFSHIAAALGNASRTRLETNRSNFPKGKLKV